MGKSRWFVTPEGVRIPRLGDHILTGGRGFLLEHQLGTNERPPYPDQVDVALRFLKNVPWKRVSARKGSTASHLKIIVESGYRRYLGHSDFTYACLLLDVPVEPSSGRPALCGVRFAAKVRDFAYSGFKGKPPKGYIIGQDDDGFPTLVSLEAET